jgi:hypothetical protein
VDPRGFFHAACADGNTKPMATIMAAKCDILIA